jgi:hypothetical protein
MVWAVESDCIAERMLVSLFLGLDWAGHFSFQNLQWICLVTQGVGCKTAFFILRMLFAHTSMHFPSWSYLFGHSAFASEFVEFVVFLGLAVFLGIGIIFDIRIFQWFKLFNSLFSGG